MTTLELIDKTDRAITELVHPKWELLKAYNYYNGVRDKDLFRYLEENFGLENPTSIEFTPLIKKHIDVLVGEYLGTPIIPKIYCKDKETISLIEREKLLSIIQEIHKFLKSHLENQVLNIINGKETTDSLVKQLLDKIVEDIETNFVSLYEIAALNVIEYIMQSRDTDMLTNLKDLILDLLISGYTFYLVKPTVGKNNIRIKALSPLNVFPDRNPESPYIKDSHRVVVRKWMDKEEILSEYGDELKREDINELEDKWQLVYDEASYYVRSLSNHGIPSTDGLLAGKEVVIPGYPNTQGKFHDFIPVYEVEWIETDKNNVMLRYETIRIGESIYITKGLNKDVIRSKNNPNYCPLSVNGVYFLNRGTKPYSLVLACAHLQDRYDILNFYRDNLIANSGTVGDWIDTTLIPTYLGVTMPERILKWLAMKKLGTALLDSSQEGRISSGQAPMNTIFNGYDDTVKLQAVSAILTAITSIEDTVTSITGVFRERLGGIEQRDAVSNVKISLQNSFIITKLYYHLMDLVVNELLLDCLNLAKKVFKKGLTGTLILGDKYLKIFTALPEHFTVSDHDIRIITSSEIIRDLEYVKSLIPDFIKNGSLAPDIIFEALTCKSLTELKHKVRKAMEKQREENNKIAQLSQQVEQLTKLLEQSTQEVKKYQNKVEQLNELKLQIEQQKIMLDNKVKWYEAQTERSYKEKMAEESKRRTEIELAQLYDGNPYNDKVRQIYD